MSGRPSGARPPRVAERLLARALPAEERDVLLGDLHETWTLRRRHGRVTAAAWYWRQVVAAPLRVALEGRRSPGGRGRAGRRFGILRDELGADLRVALRRAVQRPMLLLVAVAVLSLAVGGSTALVAAMARFSRWEPGLDDHDRLAALAVRRDGRLFNRHPAADLAAIDDALADTSYAVAAHRFAVARDEHGATSVWSAAASGSFFEVIGAELQHGRAFAPRSSEVVVSARFWRERLDGSADALGSTLWINGAPHTVVGITALPFRGLTGSPALWLPLDSLPDSERAALAVVVLGRSLGDPRADVAARRAAAALAGGDSTVESAEWIPAAEVWVPRGESTAGSRANLNVALLALLVVAAATANVVHLLLADGLERGHEMAVRAALGAGRARLLRQLLAEAMVLALAVTAGSYAFARAFLAAIPAWLPTPLPGFEERFRLPGDILLAGIGLAVFATLAANLLPAVRLSRLGAAINRASRGGTRGVRAPAALGAAQMAAAAALTLIALFLTLGMSGVHDQPLGYEEEERFSFSVDAGAVPDDAELRAAVYRAFFDALRQDPRVVASGTVGSTPGFLGPWTPVRAEGSEATVAAGVLPIGAGYLAAAGTRVVEGRALRPDDAGRPVALISRALADALWGAASPLGRAVRSGDAGEPVRVVGVVADGTYAGRSPLPVLMVPQPAAAGERILVVMHLRGDLRDATQAVQQAARAAHADLSPYALAPVSEWFERHWVLQRSVGAGMRALALLGLVISGIGVYAGFASIVARRRRELGIRLSIGASPAKLLGEILAASARIAMYGYAAGAVLGFAALRLLQAYLFDGGPGDPLPYLIGAAISLALATTASLVPAVRAARVDPAISLRAE